MENVSYTAYSSKQKRYTVAMDIYLEDERADLFGQVNTGIDLSIKFDLVQRIIYTPNIMKTQSEVYHLKDTIKQQDVFMIFSKRSLKSLDVFRHSVEKPYNLHCSSALQYLKALTVQRAPKKEKNLILIIYESSHGSSQTVFKQTGFFVCLYFDAWQRRIGSSIACFSTKAHLSVFCDYALIK